MTEEEKQQFYSDVKNCIDIHLKRWGKTAADGHEFLHGLKPIILCLLEENKQLEKDLDELSNRAIELWKRVMTIPKSDDCVKLTAEQGRFLVSHLKRQESRHYPADTFSVLRELMGEIDRQLTGKPKCNCDAESEKECKGLLGISRAMRKII